MTREQAAFLTLLKFEQMTGRAPADPQSPPYADTGTRAATLMVDLRAACEAGGFDWAEVVTSADREFAKVRRWILAARVGDCPALRNGNPHPHGGPECPRCGR